MAEITKERIAELCEQIREGKATDEDVHGLLEYFSAGSLPLLERLERNEDRGFLAGLVLLMTNLGVRHLMHVHKVTFGLPPGFERIDSRGRAAAASMVGLQLAELGDREGLTRSLQEAMQHVLTEANAKAPFAKAVIEQLYSGPLAAMVGLDVLITGLELEATEAGIDARTVREYFNRNLRIAVVENTGAGVGLVDERGRQL
jgi:hypothetical protein